jgi:hypothetical protein
MIWCRGQLTRAARSKAGIMGFCEHCEGQRFDRARVLRYLRAERRRVRRESADRHQVSQAERTLLTAIQTIRAMDIPHMERLDDIIDGELVH